MNQRTTVSWAGIECSVEGCTRGVKSMGWCLPHYKRAKRYDGDPLGRPVVPTVAERFWAKVEKSSECWEWSAGRLASGYGAFHPNESTTALAHRYSYELMVGAIPDGLVIDHLCRNRGCVNPEHLEPVTNKENLRRGLGYALQNGMRTTCIHGHEYTPENTYTSPDGGARCRTCQRVADRNRAGQRTAA